MEFEGNNEEREFGEEKKEINDDNDVGEKSNDNEWDEIDWSEVNSDEQEESIWSEINWNDDETGEQEESVWNEIDWEESESEKQTESDSKDENGELEPKQLDPNEGEENYESNEYKQYEMGDDDESNYEPYEYGDKIEQEEYSGGFYENSYAESMNTILLSENQIYEYLQEYIQLIVEKENEVKQGEQTEVDSSKEEVSELEKFLKEERERIRLEQQQAGLDEVIEIKPKSEPLVNEEEVEQEQKEGVDTQINSYEEAFSNNEKELEEELKLNLVEENQADLEEIINSEPEKVKEEIENQELELEELQSNYNEEKLEELDNDENEKYETESELLVHGEELVNFEEEREEKGESKELKKEQELPSVVQDLDISQETISNEIEVLTIHKEEEIESEISSPYKEEEHGEIEEFEDSQEELGEIFELKRKKEQQVLLEIDSYIPSKENYERVKKFYHLQTGKRPIYANKETEGFKEWLDQIKESRGKQKGEPSKEQEREQEKEEEWILFLKNWIKEESGEEISLKLKNKVIQIIEKYNELDQLSIKFQELYKQKRLNQLSQSEKKELKSFIKTLQKIDPSNIVLFTNLRALKRSLKHQKFETLSEKAQINQLFNHFFTQFSPMKQLNKILKSHKEIVIVNENKKKCHRCQRVLAYNNFEKYGGERGKKEGKQKFRTICKTCRKEVKSIRALRKKTRLILELFEGKCSNCHTGLWFLPSFEFHHTLKEHKISSWRKIYQSSFQTLKNWAINEKVNALCGNCHSKEQAKQYNEFKNLILIKNLFKLPQKEIEELINASINNHPKFRNSKVKSKIKYQIKRWIRKRFVIEQLYNGKCITCGLDAHENLPSMIFHHRNEKQKKLVWNDLRDLDCEEILKSLINENCVCICLNCHGVLHSTFNTKIEEILEGILSEKEINKFSSELNDILSRINNAISSFKFKLETIKFASPLKYIITQSEIWKLKMFNIYSYLKIKEQIEFRAKEIMSLFDNKISNAYEIISKLVEKRFLIPIKREGFTQKYYKFSEEGQNKVLEFKHTYDLQENLITSDNNQIIPKERMENDDILEIYPRIIKNIIENKGYNEFTVKELAEAIGKSTVNVSRTLREKFITNGYVKVKTSGIITKKKGSTKIFYLTENK